MWNSTLYFSRLNKFYKDFTNFKDSNPNLAFTNDQVIELFKFWYIDCRDQEIADQYHRNEKDNDIDEEDEDFFL